jgi:hypothetical protein
MQGYLGTSNRGDRLVSFYESYKPFRDCMRRFPLTQSLMDIWAYSNHIVDRHPLPHDFAPGRGPEQLPYSWELETLTREIVLNGGDNEQTLSLRRWRNLARAVDHIRRLDEEACRQNGDTIDALFELHRIGHRQLPWQQDKGMAPIMRVLKIFGAASVEAVVLRELGMTTVQFLQLGAAVAGSFIRNVGMSTRQDYRESLGISIEASAAFFDRLSCDIEQLKTDTVSYQSYDDGWLYAWNPLERTPLIRFDREHPDRVICPIPRYLLRRTSAGLFYDLVNSTGFQNPYGESFQSYVGDILRATCGSSRFRILSEQTYRVGKRLKHGVDWILSDATGHVFVECKAKRLRVTSKTRSDKAALEKDLIVLATAVVQNYSNIRDALDGNTQWKADSLPIYPVILTLENWLIFSPWVSDLLLGHVRGLLREQGLPDTLVDEMPFAIASSADFEVASQIIAQTGIEKMMAQKTDTRSRGWMLAPSLSGKFEDEMRNINWRLFSDDWEKLVPDAIRSGLPSKGT